MSKQSNLLGFFKNLSPASKKKQFDRDAELSKKQADADAELHRIAEAKALANKRPPGRPRKERQLLDEVVLPLATTSTATATVDDPCVNTRKVQKKQLCYTGWGIQYMIQPDE